MRYLIPLFLVLVTPSAGRADPSLVALGTVCWNRDALDDAGFAAQRRSLGERCLSFISASVVSSSLYLAGAKEAFSADGRYGIDGNALTLRHDGDLDGWTDRTKPLPPAVTCNFSITTRPSLVLRDCVLSGEWLP